MRWPSLYQAICRKNKFYDFNTLEYFSTAFKIVGRIVELVSEKETEIETEIFKFDDI